MSRVTSIVVGLLALQAVLLAGYLTLDAAEPDAPFLWERLELPAPASLDVGGGMVVVHFWATWCGPCLAELPELLTVAEDEGVRLIAVTDEAASVVQRFFHGEVPAAIAIDPTGHARRDYGVSGLPETFLVRDGRVVARVGGPRSWDTQAGRRFLLGAPR